jgi:hypothetical protein
MEHNELEALKKKVKKQKITIAILGAYVVFSLLIQLYNMFA